MIDVIITKYYWLVLYAGQTNLREAKKLAATDGASKPVSYQEASLTGLGKGLLYPSITRMKDAN